MPDSDVPDLAAGAARLRETPAAIRRTAAESVSRLDATRKLLAKRDVVKAAAADEVTAAELERSTATLAEERQRAEEWAVAIEARLERWSAAVTALERL